jgi:hypothetical protein
MGACLLLLLVRLSFRTIIFSQSVVFFSHNKLDNSIFSRLFLAKRLAKNKRVKSVAGPPHLRAKSHHVAVERAESDACMLELELELRRPAGCMHAIDAGALAASRRHGQSADGAGVVITPSSGYYTTAVSFRN